MRKIKKISVDADVESLGVVPKRVKFVSPGIAIRNHTWTGFGAGAGLLGFEDVEDAKSSDILPNIEDSNFVESLLEDDSKEVEVENDGAE